MSWRKTEWVPDIRPNAEAWELINPPVELAPDEGYIRFHHINADGTPGQVRRVKFHETGLDEVLRRCAKEFGT